MFDRDDDQNESTAYVGRDLSLQHCGILPVRLVQTFSPEVIFAQQGNLEITNTTLAQPILTCMPQH
jgi:hypothetical protein